MEGGVSSGRRSFEALEQRLRSVHSQSGKCRANCMSSAFCVTISTGVHLGCVHRDRNSCKNDTKQQELNKNDRCLFAREK